MRGYVGISNRQYNQLREAEGKNNWKFGLPADGYVEPSDACVKQDGKWFMEKSAYNWWKEQGVITDLNATACIFPAMLLGSLVMFNPMFWMMSAGNVKK